jgi:putative transcriptional regulator
MIIFNDILKMLSNAGWSTYRLKKEKQISNGTILQLRNGKPINTTTVDKICELCNCQPGDIMKYVPNNKDYKERGE